MVRSHLDYTVVLCGLLKGDIEALEKMQKGGDYKIVPQLKFMAYQGMSM